MPLFRVHFAATQDEPFPPLETLPAVEADPTHANDLVEAVKVLLAQGRVPQNRPVNWPRVVINCHPNGYPRQVLSVPLTPDKIIPVDWNADTRD